MTVESNLAQILNEPTPATVWDLRKELLIGGFSLESNVLVVLDEFYAFLNDLVASSTARQYSHFASLLDMGAVAGVAVQNLMESKGSEEWFQRLIVGGISEAMMVAAARQYVKAWEEEMRSNYNAAAWYLFGEFWRLSAALLPDMPPNDRRLLVDQLVKPILDEENGGIVKAAIIVHYFQIILIAHLKEYAL